MNDEPANQLLHDDEPTTLRRRARLRVLLAEDDDELRTFLASVMRRDGHEVVEARDGRELLARFRERVANVDAFDVVISDVMMPGATGVTVLTGVANTVDPPWMVVISAFGDWDLHAWADAIGAVAMFDKPFDVDDLRTVLLNLEKRAS